MSLIFTEQVWVNSSVSKEGEKKPNPRFVLSELSSETVQCPMLKVLKLLISKAKLILQGCQPETTNPFGPAF